MFQNIILQRDEGKDEFVHEVWFLEAKLKV